MKHSWGIEFRRLFSLMTCLIFPCIQLTACATTAPRQDAPIAQSSTVGEPDVKACFEKALSNPAYQALFEHLPVKKATPAQLADSGVPGDKEADLIIAYHNERAPCIARWIEGTMKTSPGLIPVYTESWIKVDLVNMNLILRKTTWGEANKQHLALSKERGAKLQAFVEEIRQARPFHQKELAQRQAALNALQDWYEQQQQNSQQLMQSAQRQQLTNTMNRPLITNCEPTGDTVQCKIK